MDQITADQIFDLSVSGMTCASCVSRVEKVLGRVPGVHAVSVNLATETAHVSASPGTAIAGMVAAVGRAGYKAQLRPLVAAKPGNREFLELCAAAALSAPLLFGMFFHLSGWLAFALATPVQVWLGARFYIAGFNALRGGAATMDVLVALGTSAAYGLSAADFFAGGPLYFESSAVVITLIRLGKFFETRAKREAALAVTGLAKLRPSIAHRGGADVPVAALRLGDVIELRPGERVPMDGTILTGAGSFDESHVTGESQPVSRGAGGKLLAGALNQDGVLTMQVTVAQGETLLDRMARLIDSAQASKPKLQKLADRVAAVFVPAVCVIALATFAGWLLVHAPLATAVINAVSVLVIACPCALGLATPAAIMAGTGMAAKHGILIRNADAIEQAASVDVVVFDKTGTLTLGHPALTGTHLFGRMPNETVMAIAAALAAGDTHPLAVPLRRPGAAPAENIRALPGRGIEGNVAGARFILGSRQLIEEAGGAAPAFDAPGATISYLATADGHVLAAFTFADQLRPGAKAAIAQLQARNIHVALLSGDRAAAAAPIAAALGITDITADASPAQKLAAIDAWRAAGRVVAMVGDGVNDGPALAAANIGLAIGTGADVAIETADFSLLRPEPKLVADALVLSKRIWRTLREGLFWAVIYNVVGIPLAALGYLSPTAAGAAMAASSVCVLANALRLRNWRPS